MSVQLQEAFSYLIKALAIALVISPMAYCEATVQSAKHQAEAVTVEIQERN